MFLVYFCPLFNLYHPLRFVALDIIKETHRKLEEDRGEMFGVLGAQPQFKGKAVSPDLKRAEQLAKGHRLSSTSGSREAEAEHKLRSAEEMFQMIQAYMEVRSYQSC